MEQKKNQWHPGFAAALRMELKDNRDDLEFEEERPLNKKPLQIDVLIIKNYNKVEIKNKIGKLFDRYNIVEYKSPQDAMGIDTFYKVLGYAALYKVSSEKEDGYKAEEITITLVRQSYPAMLMKYLKQRDCVVNLVYPGVYYISGKIMFKMQIIVSKDLDHNDNIWLRSLHNNISKETYHKLLNSVQRLGTKERELYGEAVLQVVTNANKTRIETWKEESNMCEALAEIMAPELEANRQKARNEGLAEGRAEGRVQGLAEGRAEGRVQGLAEGRVEGKLEGKVLAFAEVGLSVQDIADKVCLSVEEVERIIESDKK